MHAWSSGGDPRNSTRQHSGKITFYTLLCFSLAGLIFGFAIGGFAGRHATSMDLHAGSSSANTSSINGHTSNPSISQLPEDVFLGEPSIAPGDYVYQEQADGTTSYTLAAQILNKNSNTPITASDVVCRLWLTDDPNATTTALNANNDQIPRTISSFNQPFPNEIAGALNFASASQQTHPCAANGKTTWTYTISPTVGHGTYYLAVLADWEGKHFNWYMISINITSKNG